MTKSTSHRVLAAAVRSHQGSVSPAFISRSIVVQAGRSQPTRAGQPAAAHPVLGPLAHCLSTLKAAWSLTATPAGRSAPARTLVAISPVLLSHPLPPQTFIGPSL